MATAPNDRPNILRRPKPWRRIVMFALVLPCAIVSGYVFAQSIAPEEGDSLPLLPAETSSAGTTQPQARVSQAQAAPSPPEPATATTILRPRRPAFEPGTPAAAASQVAELPGTQATTAPAGRTTAEGQQQSPTYPRAPAGYYEQFIPKTETVEIDGRDVAITRYERGYSPAQAAPQDGTSLPRWQQPPASTADSANQSGLPYRANAPRGLVPNRYTNISTEEAQVRKLVAKLRQQEEADRDPELLEELNSLVKKQFEQRHQKQVERLEQILADANRSQEILNERSEQKETIIARRISELLGGIDPLGWNYPAPQSPTYTLPRPFYTVPAPVAPNSATPSPNFPSRNAQTDDSRQAWSQAPQQFVQPTHPQLPQPAGNPGNPAYRQPDLIPVNPDPAIAKQPSADLYIPNDQPPPAQRQQDASSASAQVAAGESDVFRAAFAVRQLRGQLKRLQQLHQRNAVSSSELENAKWRLEEAEARLLYKQRALESQLELLMLELESGKQQLDLSRELMVKATRDSASGKVPQTDVTEARHEVLVAEQKLRAADVQLRTLQDQVEWLRDFRKELDSENSEEDSRQSDQGDSELQADEDAVSSDS